MKTVFVILLFTLGFGAAATAQPDASSRPRARDLGLAPRRAVARRLERHHRRRGGPRRAGDDLGRRRRAHRRHDDPAARRQPLPGEGARRHAPRQRLRQARRLQPGERARLHRDAHRAHGDARGVERGERRGQLRARAPGQRGGALCEPRRGRDQRRLPQRHPRTPRRGGARARVDPGGPHRPGPGGRRRGRHRDLRLRVEGRHRHLLAEAPESLGGYTVGALVQSNYGGVLQMDGLPVGEELGATTCGTR